MPWKNKAWAGLLASMLIVKGTSFDNTFKQYRFDVSNISVDASWFVECNLLHRPKEKIEPGQGPRRSPMQPTGWRPSQCSTLLPPLPSQRRNRIQNGQIHSFLIQSLRCVHRMKLSLPTLQLMSQKSQRPRFSTKLFIVSNLLMYKHMGTGIHAYKNVYFWVLPSSKNKAYMFEDVSSFVCMSFWLALFVVKYGKTYSLSSIKLKADKGLGKWW